MYFRCSTRCDYPMQCYPMQCDHLKYTVVLPAWRGRSADSGPNYSGFCSGLAVRPFFRDIYFFFFILFSLLIPPFLIPHWHSYCVSFVQCSVCTVSRSYCILFVRCIIRTVYRLYYCRHKTLVPVSHIAHYAHYYARH